MVWTMACLVKIWIIFFTNCNSCFWGRERKGRKGKGRDWWTSEVNTLEAIYFSSQPSVVTSPPKQQTPQQQASTKLKAATLNPSKSDYCGQVKLACSNLKPLLLFSLLLTIMQLGPPPAELCGGQLSWASSSGGSRSISISYRPLPQALPAPPPHDVMLCNLITATTRAWRFTSLLTGHCGLTWF